MNKKVKDLEIAILHQISRAVLQEHNASLLLKNVLDVLSHEIGFQRGTFTLLRDDTLYIEASQGLTEEEIKRGKYQLGDFRREYLHHRGDLPDTQILPPAPGNAYRYARRDRAGGGVRSANRHHRFQIRRPSPHPADARIGNPAGLTLR